MKSLERKILANQFREQIEAVLTDNGMSACSVFDYNDLCGLMAAGILAEREKCRMICIDQAGRHAAYKSGKAEADAARACAKVIMGADPFEAYPGER